MILCFSYREGYMTFQVPRRDPHRFRSSLHQSNLLLPPHEKHFFPKFKIRCILSTTTVQRLLGGLDGLADGIILIKTSIKISLKKFYLIKKRPPRREHSQNPFLHRSRNILNRPAIVQLYSTIQTSLFAFKHNGIKGPV